jgi:hypothetical protein
MLYYVLLNIFYNLISEIQHLSAGGQCNCSSYSTLLYALFAGVAVLLLLLMLLIYWVRSRALHMYIALCI